jgi:hypothetical protein
MFKLFDFECLECGRSWEALVGPGEDSPACVCGATQTERLPFVVGTATRAQVNPAKMREIMGKAKEMRNKWTGKTPWRKNSWSQTSND